MPVAKKLMVAVSVVAAGAGAAMFFRKDASLIRSRQVASNEAPFRDRVERRVASEASWRGGPSRAVGGSPGQAQPALRVPTTPTAAIAPSTQAAAENQPEFRKNFHPVGALLEPIDGIAEESREDPVADDTSAAEIPYGAPADALRTHQIIDGDTLSKLAMRYLGQGDRYREIFDLNRDLLASPDLLPIGAVLKIPPREIQAPSPSKSWQGTDPGSSETRNTENGSKLVPVASPALPR